jgi:hypothetical protein
MREPQGNWGQKEKIVSTLEERRQSAKFVDVVIPMSGWDDDSTFTVYRFPNDETGHGRAVEYRNAFNESLRKAMGVSEADLELERPDWGQRPNEYDRALKVEQYRDKTAGLAYPETKRFVSNDAPLPTDYPHDY